MSYPTKEDFDLNSPGDYMDLVDAEHRARSELDAAWEWRARQDDGAFPSDVPDAELLAQYRAAQRQAANRRHIWRWFAVLSSIAIVGALFATCGALPAGAHDLAAWSDPARDKWFRGLQVPGSNTSCCNFTDGAQIDPEKVSLRGTVWYVDLGKGFVPVPPERVVTAPVSIDGMPYVFMMAMPTADSPNGIRCFVPPVGTY